MRDMGSSVTTGVTTPHEIWLQCNHELAVEVKAHSTDSETDNSSQESFDRPNPSQRLLSVETLGRDERGDGIRRSPSALFLE